MSGKFNFTDRQWYNFICGLYAGFRLKDLDAPPYENNTILFPIPVGGYGKIGLAIPEIVYQEGVNNISVPIYTHDVDIDYSGFSVNIEWDYSRLAITGVSQGDFGTIGGADSNADIRVTWEGGKLKGVGLRNSNTIFKEPVILFYMNMTIMGEVTKDSPIPIRFVDKSYTDINYCTLLKWVDTGDGVMVNFFITPLLNVSGGIVSDKESNKGTIGDDTIIAAPGSNSGVYVGSAFTAPGNEGVVPIVACSNKKDNFPFNGVYCSVEVEDNVSLFSYVTVVGTEGFSASATYTVLDNGHLRIDIEASRSTAAMDAVTFCYIKYGIAGGVDSYYIPLRNLESELRN